MLKLRARGLLWDALSEDLLPVGARPKLTLRRPQSRVLLCRWWRPNPRPLALTLSVHVANQHPAPSNLYPQVSPMYIPYHRKEGMALSLMLVGGSQTILRIPHTARADPKSQSTLGFNNPHQRSMGVGIYFLDPPYLDLLDSCCVFCAFLATVFGKVKRNYIGRSR